MTSFAALAEELNRSGVHYLLMGVSGVNLYAHDAGLVFSTMDRDLFLPPDPANLLAAWRACERIGLALASRGEPLDQPRDALLAQRIVQLRATTRAGDGAGLAVDLSLVMQGFEFEDVWNDRTTFLVDGVHVPVARLAHIVASKAACGREKDRLFLATHVDALRQILGSARDPGP